LFPVDVPHISAASTGFAGEKMKNHSDALLKRIALGALDFALRPKPIRRWALAQGDKKLHDFFVNQNSDKNPQRVQEMRYLAISNLLHALDKAYEEGRLSDTVRKGLLRVFVGQVITGESERMRPFREEHGYEPPSFLTISPTQKCNLMCKGCYAMSSSADRATLSYDVFRRILQDKRAQWGSHLTVISGGEPLIYKSEGKTLLDIVEEFDDCYFMMYTNGTLIDDEVAARMSELGNISPAISMEGWETETDGRRGKGVYRRIETAMDNLRRHGVLFGISVTATRQNAEVVLSDKFMDHFFGDKGAVYGWIFQYMPIGRSSTLEMMVTPEQRQWMLKRESELIFRRKMFLIDFWNGGALSVGCISAGRAGGYFYIDWNGNISPCVFFPYSIDNIYTMYQDNRSLSSILSAPLFKSIRSWQKDYRGNGNGTRTQNLFAPCPMRDHYAFAHDAIRRFEAKPMDEEAARAVQDQGYHGGMVQYGMKTAELLDPVWEQEIYSDNPIFKA
jgi:MoaA/NifB/PqqE/SkfB family radical SAM enzyme